MRGLDQRGGGGTGACAAIHLKNGYACRHLPLPFVAYHTPIIFYHKHTPETIFEKICLFAHPSELRTSLFCKEFYTLPFALCTASLRQSPCQQHALLQRMANTALRSQCNALKPRSTLWLKYRLPFLESQIKSVTDNLFGPDWYVLAHSKSTKYIGAQNGITHHQLDA